MMKKWILGMCFAYVAGSGVYLYYQRAETKVVHDSPEKLQGIRESPEQVQKRVFATIETWDCYIFVNFYVSNPEADWEECCRRTKDHIRMLCDAADIDVGNVVVWPPLEQNWARVYVQLLPKKHSRGPWKDDALDREWTFFLIKSLKMPGILPDAVGYTCPSEKEDPS